jgi:lipopolysaccharide export system protein LptC
MLPFTRFSIRAAGALTLAVCLLGAPGCGAQRPREAQQVVPELKLEGVRFRVFRGEALRVAGEARTASLRRDSSEVALRDLVATLPRDGGDVRITAAEGEGVLASRTFEATGDVVVAQGDTVGRTTAARYLPEGGEKGLVRGDRPVVVEGPGYRLEGPRFTLDPASGVIAIEGGATLEAGVPGER